ncbi:DMSO/TMAO reductase YedYZ, molybdopterin-dependent catalytic subunit [Leifsonia sp. 98AMF]|uniref:molybdopterin-dependent oxidoreductase n=1 Tax=unclassified Leifsonia TaxID=2663824 RepID=UPI00087AF4B5|nr:MULTISPECIES: molybdopterin-dependent oxidoreductase [unclassified Leifsonia]SDH26081.1 DMSO/TMAO reductase YedYZ, molybdopterin-dependent catalytic subunit [Leifsonia sp. 197AMF]SDJ12433.1 DMSO/TMAO reductase YedYZ, molybdopterin-dependent catalytic subunit [Leifsonia sp. 466MF]SDJ56870.1 DMSO/TMAO reductase YedYZ, molybdopterin-dependent catalytic subunit [Leifsonia sp. 157MF]SDN33913.1 DMSO/TMAO reductase YedYZ, molybdopterin-dependent catalytic subunit [Leifsonia sp. 509MF]SEM87747.1 DM
MSDFWRPAGAGVASVVAGVGVAELVSAFVVQNGSPILTVGALLIDLAPPWLKEAVIGLFGTGDKAFLIVSLAVVVVVGAGIAGWLERVRPPLGRILIGLGGAVGVLAAVTRSGNSIVDALPSVLAAGVAILLLGWLMRMLRDTEPTRVAPSGRVSRRRFVGSTAATAAGGALALIVGQVVAGGFRAASATRAAIRLPKPAETAPPIPAGASFDIPGLSPIVTPNADFYRIDTALQIPGIDPNDWRLRITGMVENEVELTFAQLLALPLEESTTTLTCVSNEVGGDLIGNATWLGYPIRHLLARAKPSADADMVLSTSQDGWTASTPIETLTDERNAILAVGMNGQPLPLEHGYPVRMVVPGLYGYVSATKWVVSMEVTRFDQHTSYWTDRGWSERGPVKLSSRIDVPAAGRQVKAGTVAVAGVAWSQHVGVSAVQVKVDDGPWQQATLADAISADTWRQWRFAWEATPGAHTLRVRATDAKGKVQTAAVQDVVPDGATGLHSVRVTVV